MDHSTTATTFNQAMKEAKRHYNIPKNQNPLDRRDKKQPGYVYIYKDIHEKEIEFRDDRAGHKFEDGYYLPPHINGPNEEHYFHNGKGEIHNVELKEKKKNKI